MWEVAEPCRDRRGGLPESYLSLAARWMSIAKVREPLTTYDMARYEQAGYGHNEIFIGRFVYGWYLAFLVPGTAVAVGRGDISLWSPLTFRAVRFVSFISHNQEMVGPAGCGVCSPSSLRRSVAKCQLALVSDSLTPSGLLAIRIQSGFAA